MGDLKVSAHVSRTPNLDFAGKNFEYEVMPMREFIRRARGVDGDTRLYYYRSQHAKRNKPSSLEVLGSLAEDFSLPEPLLEGYSVHSTVLRIASAGLRMWLHYDICDNFLCCIRGRKRVVLIPPSEVGNFYVNGSSSALGSRALDPAPANLAQLWREYPLAREAWEGRHEILLEEGDVLFIPALWLHCTEAVPGAGALDGVAGGNTLCISVNVFLMRTELEPLHDPKDVWANRELLPAQEALKAFEEKVLPNFARLPPEHCAFYCRKAASALLVAAEERVARAAAEDRVSLAVPAPGG